MSDSSNLPPTSHESPGFWHHFNPRKLIWPAAIAIGAWAMSEYKEQGFLAWIPDWTPDAALFIAFLLLIYSAWTQSDVQRYRQIIYNRRPKMLLAILMIVGAVLGATVGAFGYWAIKRQNQRQDKPATESQTAQVTKTEASPASLPPLTQTPTPTPTPQPSETATPTLTPTPQPQSSPTTTTQPSPQPQSDEDSQPKLSKKEVISQLSQLIGEGQTILRMWIQKHTYLFKDFSGYAISWEDKMRKFLRNNLGESYALRFDSLFVIEKYPGLIEPPMEEIWKKQMIDKFYTKTVRLEEILKELESAQN